MWQDSMQLSLPGVFASSSARFLEISLLSRTERLEKKKKIKSTGENSTKKLRDGTPSRRVVSLAVVESALIMMYIVITPGRW